MTTTVTTLTAGPFTPTGLAQSLPFDFKAHTASELEVVQIDEDGVETTVDPADYAVELNVDGGGAAAEGGSVELEVGAASVPAGDLYVRALPSFEQEQVWDDDASSLRNLNEALDRAALRDLHLRDRLIPIETVFPTILTSAASAVAAAASAALILAGLEAGTYTQQRLILGGTTVTADTPLISGTQTWNNAAVTFTGIKLDVTDTASQAASKLLDLKLGGTSKFSVGKAGTISAASGLFSVDAGGIPTVGTYGSGSSDAGYILSRDMNDASTTSGHGFVAADLFRRGGGAAYAAFDATVTMQANAYDHWAGFQDRVTFQASVIGQTMNDMYGLFSKPAIDAGEVTRRHGVYVAAPTLVGGGTIATQHGVYVEALTAATANWAIYTAGATPSYFGGPVTLNAGIAGGFSAASGLFSVASTGIATVGTYGATSTDPGMVISRNMFDASTTPGHGFVEATYFRRGGTSAFAAFDALTTMAGNGYDHWAAFQDRGAWQPASGAQVMNDMFGLFSKPSLDAGTVTRRYGAYVDAPTITGGGAITTQYGYYVASLTAGATNWAFYADGATPSYFGGPVTLNGGVTGRITQTVPANTAAYQSTGYSLTGANAQTLMDLAGTWDTTGNPRAFNISITNTASGSSSTLLRAAVNTVVQFSVGTTGNLYAAGKGSFGTTSTTTALNIAGAPNDNAGMVKIQSSSTADNAGITLFGRSSGGATNARNWQISNNYSGTGNLDIFRSTSNTGNPTTHVASFDMNGNLGLGVVLATQKLDVDGAIKKKVYTVATLPTGAAGSEAWVSDANATWAAGIGTVVVGGGGNVVPVGHDGTNWRIG